MSYFNQNKAKLYNILLLPTAHCLKSANPDTQQLTQLYLCTE
jgi:hypothetical protein